MSVTSDSDRLMSPRAHVVKYCAWSSLESIKIQILILVLILYFIRPFFFVFNFQLVFVHVLYGLYDIFN